MSPAGKENQPTSYVDCSKFIDGLARKQLSLAEATKELRTFRARYVEYIAEPGSNDEATLKEWTTVPDDLIEDCGRSATSTQVPEENLFDIGDLDKAACEVTLKKREAVEETVLEGKYGFHETRSVTAAKAAAGDGASQHTVHPTPEKRAPPALGDVGTDDGVAGRGLVAGLFGDGGFQKAVPPLPEANLTIAGAKSKTRMSAHTDRDRYVYANPTIGRVSKHNLPPVTPETITGEQGDLCAELREFILSAVVQAIRFTGAGLSESLVQRLFHPAAIVLAHALGIDMDMRDGRGSPKIVLFDGLTTLVGLLDVYGVLKYLDDVDVCAIDIELKTNILGGRQLVQLMDQLLGLTARHTAGRGLDLSSVSMSGVRCCLGLLGNGITGVAVTWLGPAAGLPTHDGIPKQTFYLESADAKTGIFGLLAEKMIKSVRLRAKCLAKNGREDASAAGKRYCPNPSGGTGADGPSDDHTLPPTTPRQGSPGAREPGPAYDGTPPASGSGLPKDTATGTVGKRPKVLTDLSNQVDPARRSETVLRPPTPPPVEYYNPFERFLVE